MEWSEKEKRILDPLAAQSTTLQVESNNAIKGNERERNKVIKKGRRQDNNVCENRARIELVVPSISLSATNIARYTSWKFRQSLN